MTLYLIVAACPSCGEENNFVEEREKPVALDQEVTITSRFCEHCGHEEGSDGGEWDLHSDHEIERVQPTQERNL